MRIVVDTNNVVSRYIVPVGPSARIMEHWEHETFDLVVSESMLAEYERVLNYERIRRRHGLSPAQVRQVIERFRRFAILVAPTQALDVVSEDPSDNRFLECALAGNAAFIISGDHHLLRLGAHEGIQILRATAFLTLIEQQHL